MLKANGGSRRPMTYSAGPGREHYLDIEGEGSRNPTRAQVHGLGRRHSLSNRLIDVIIDEVRAAVADWPRAAEDAGVTRASRAGRPPGGRHDVPDLVCRPTG